MAKFPCDIFVKGIANGGKYEDGMAYYNVWFEGGDSAYIPSSEICDPWVLARRIAVPDGPKSFTQDELDEIFGTSCDRLAILSNYSFDEVVEKINKWEERKYEVKVWDVVDYEGDKVVVTKIDFRDQATVTRGNGNATQINKDFLKPTGINIASLVNKKLSEVSK